MYKRKIVAYVRIISQKHFKDTESNYAQTRSALPVYQLRLEERHPNMKQALQPQDRDVRKRSVGNCPFVHPVET
jgi:hypothetical protein